MKNHDTNTPKRHHTSDGDPAQVYAALHDSYAEESDADAQTTGVPSGDHATVSLDEIRVHEPIDHRHQHQQQQLSFLRHPTTAVSKPKQEQLTALHAFLETKPLVAPEEYSPHHRDSAGPNAAAMHAGANVKASLYGKDFRRFVSLGSLEMANPRHYFASDWSDSDFSLNKHDLDELSLRDPHYDLTSSKLSKLFSHFVFDDNGMVEYDGFRKGLEAMGIVCHDDQTFETFLAKVDEDNSGKISYEEFQHAVQEIKLAQLFQKEFVKDVIAEDTRRLAKHQMNETSFVGVPSAPQTMATPPIKAVPRPPPRLGVIEYSPDRIRSIFPVQQMEQFIYSKKPSWASVRWINVENCDLLTLRRLSVRYRLHPLAVEKALDVENERQKFEIYDEHSCVILHSLHGVDMAKLRKYQLLYRNFLFCKEDSTSLLDQITDRKDIEARLAELKCIMTTPEQMNLYLFSDVLISIQQGKSALWQVVKARLDTSYSKIRQHGANFLVHTILDACADDLNPIVQAFGAKLLLLEKLMHLDEHDFDVKRVQYCSRQLMALQQVCKRFVELVNHLCESRVFEKEIVQYFRDVRDNLLNVEQDCDKHLATCRSLIEEFQTIRATRQGEVSYTLSVVAAIFLPAQFLTGLYGMNFENMPELHTQYGYLVWWLCTLVIAGGTFGFFRFYKKWL